MMAVNKRMQNETKCIYLIKVLFQTTRGLQTRRIKFNLSERVVEIRLI